MENFVNLPIFRKQQTMLDNLNIATPKKKLLIRASTLFSSLKTENEQGRKPLNLPPILLEKTDDKVPEPKFSKRPHGMVHFYAGCTSAGNLSKNEDRVVMINTTLKPSGRVCSYFAIFDGFSGSFTCNFLRDNLHGLILKHPLIETNTGKAISDSFEEAERQILTQHAAKCKKSGACALVTVIIDKYIYIANLGSSRSYLSSLKGFEKNIVTKEHFLFNEEEKKRVLQNGGELYEINGSLRIKPGNLNIGRCFGCSESKKTGAVIAIPDIKSSKIRKKMDFLLLISDGVWSVLNKYEIINTLWSSLDSTNLNPKEKVSTAVKSLLSKSLNKDSDDNISAILIGFPALSQLI